MMLVRLSPLAIIDIEEIGDYIARDNPVRAVSFTDELQKQCQALGEAPLLYALRPEFGEGVRTCAYGRYVIAYSVGEYEVRVERVLHGARDISGLLWS